jgi:ribonucleotide reductase beta subunit family protein with ferritin-like domain
LSLQKKVKKKFVYFFQTEKKKMEEPLTIVSDDRYCLFPIQHQDVWDLYKAQQMSHWTVEEIDFSEDYKKWQLLTLEEQEFISITLAFFANSDNLVIENLHARFRIEMTWPESQAFFTAQAEIEMIHVETYNKCIDVVIRDSKKKKELFEAIKCNPIVKPKLDWTKKWIESKEDLGTRLVAFALVEGVFFSSSFASMFWLRKQKNVPGICFANEKIVEDEALHVLHGTLSYTKIVNKMKLEDIYNMVREAVAIEHEFVENALPVKLIGMNSKEMKQYVCFQADLILTLLGVPKLYNVEIPFEWMIGIGLVGKSNFFEKRVGEYALIGDESKIRTVQFTSLGNSLDF